MGRKGRKNEALDEREMKEDEKEEWEKMGPLYIGNEREYGY